LCPKLINHQTPIAMMAGASAGGIDTAEANNYREAGQGLNS
jgi:hypothetical protein